MKDERIARKIYEAMPCFLQDWMISGYGYLLKRKRYGHDSTRTNEEVASLISDDPTQVEKRLKYLLGHAIETVPYYRDKYERLFSQRHDIGLEEFRRYFDLLDKDVVREGADSFISGAFVKEDLAVINTSGTSGTPLKILADDRAIRINYAFFNYFLGLYGLSEFDRSATFAGRVLIPKKQERPPYWRKNYAMQTLLMSSYHLSDASIPLYINELERWRPKYIDSYPSAIFEIAHYIVENKISHTVRPEVIVTSSETLKPRTRQIIEKAFGCPVVDQYGCAEMAVCAFQLPDGRYFCPPAYSLVEIVDEAGQPVAPGEWGEIVCTGLVNDVMPLIRYRIGDTARATGVGANPSGLFSYLAEIGGRRDDLIITPDGKHVGRLDPVFKGIDGIVECQIVQNAVDTIEVRVVVGPGYSDEIENRLRLALEERIGDNIHFDFKKMDRIPRGHNGKFRSVISNLAAGQ